MTMTGDVVLPRTLDTDLARPVECGKCGDPIVWAVMDKSGKRNPLDRAPNGDGQLVVVGWQVTPHGVAPVVEHLRGELADRLQGARYESHFSTCPERPRS